MTVFVLAQVSVNVVHASSTTVNTGPYTVAASIIAALATVTAAVIAALYSARASRNATRAATHAENADHAVNGRKPGELKMIEMVDQIHEQVNSLSDADALHMERAERIERAIERVDVKTERNGDRLFELEKKIDGYT